MWWWLLACGTSPSSKVSSSPSSVSVPIDGGGEAREALRRGEHELALKGFDEASSSGSIGIAIQRAHALRIAGKTDEARRAYEAIVRKTPENLMANLVLGELARTEERWADALPYLVVASGLAPSSPVPWEHRAVCLWELGRKDDALDALARAEALGSTQSEVLRQSMR